MHYAEAFPYQKQTNKTKTKNKTKQKTRTNKKPNQPKKTQKNPKPASWLEVDISQGKKKKAGEDQNLKFALVPSLPKQDLYKAVQKI